jgi:DNA-binding transcriptional LysR family regulator
VDTKFLSNFIVIVETGSIAEASRRTNVSPTALSQQVKALEKEMATPLMLRAGRTAVPTAAGHRLAASAKELLRDIIAMRQSVTALEQATEFRLGTIHTALQAFVPDTLVQLSRTSPSLNVFIKAGNAGALLEEVIAGDLDAAIIPHPQFDLSKGLHWRELIAEPLVVLAPEHLRAVPPHELLERQPFISYDRQHWGGRLAERYLREAGIVPHEKFALSSLLTIAIMVDRGLGVSLVPDSIYPAPPGLRLAKLALPGPFEPRRIGVVWRRGSVLNEIAAKFVEYASVVIRQLVDDVAAEAKLSQRNGCALKV